MGVGVAPEDPPTPLTPVGAPVDEDEAAEAETAGVVVTVAMTFPSLVTDMLSYALKPAKRRAASTRKPMTSRRAV